MVVFLIVILNIWRPKKSFSSKSYSFSQRCVVQAWWHPLIIVFDCENSFHPSGAIQESFQFDSPKAIISEDLFVLNIQLSFSKSYRCIVQISSSQFMISLFHLCLNSVKYLYSFSNSSRWIAPLLLSFQILTVVRSRVLFLGYHINLFVVLILLVVHWRPSHVWRYIYLNPFYENK